jgi:pimeloyl-ACP methyl ester carboxylesterase
MTAAARPNLRSSILAAGTGAPVLLLHSSASSGAMWAPIIKALKPRFRLIAPDLIGYGRTDPWPSGHDFTPDDEVRLLEPLLKNEPTGTHVVAHSYGGVIALHLAMAGRVAIRSLTLIEPVAFFALPHAGAREAWSEIEAVGATYAARIAAGETEAALRGFIDYWGGAGAWAAMDEPLREQIRRSAGKIVLDFQVTFTDPGMAALRALKPPVRLLSGTRTREPTRRIASFLAGQLPQATLQVVEGANHLLPITHHAMLGEFLLEHLSD